MALLDDAVTGVVLSSGHDFSEAFGGLLHVIPGLACPLRTF
jgi:hypothetical protein